MGYTALLLVLVLGSVCAWTGSKAVSVSRYRCWHRPIVDAVVFNNFLRKKSVRAGHLSSPITPYDGAGTEGSGARLRVGTLNMRSAQGGNLEATIKSMKKMNVDIALLTETKLATDRHTKSCFGYTVAASAARSSSRGGVVFIFKTKHPQFSIE